MRVYRIEHQIYEPEGPTPTEPRGGGGLLPLPPGHRLLLRRGRRGEAVRGDPAGVALARGVGERVSQRAHDFLFALCSEGVIRDGLSPESRRDRAAVRSSDVSVRDERSMRALNARGDELTLYGVDDADLDAFAREVSRSRAIGSFRDVVILKVRVGIKHE